MSKPISPDPSLLQDPDPNISGTRRRMTIYYNTPAVPDVGLPLVDIGTIDIANPIKENYASYLSSQTINAQNNIPIAPESSVGHFYETSNPEQVQYVSNGENNPSGIPNAITNFFVTPSQFNFIGHDKVGVSEPNLVSTRTFKVKNYIKNINVDSVKHEEIIAKQLLSTTGFNQDNKFVVVSGENDKPDNRLKLGTYFYKTKGEYATGSFVRGVADTNKNTLYIEHLQRIGLNILYDAVQAGAGPDTDPTNGSGGFSEAELTMAIPSLPRIGKKVRLSRFSPSYEAKKLFGADKPSNPSFIDNEYGENPTMTHGNTYNPFAQFDSLISVGQIAVCIALVIAFVLILELTAFFIPHSSEPPVGFDAQANNKILLGTSTEPNLPAYPTDGMSGGEFLQQFLGIKGLFTYTYHAFDDCLQNGLEEFFGVPGLLDRGGTGAALASGALRILLENGRMNVVLRSIIRNGISIIEDSDLNGGPYSIESIGRIIRNIRDSKILSFVNTLAQIGDKIAWEKKYAADAPPNAIESNVSFIEAMPETRPFVIAKSRLSSGKLAWGVSNSPMLHLPLVSLFVSGSDDHPRLETGIDSYGNAILNLSMLDLLLRYAALHPEIIASASVDIGGHDRSLPTRNRLSKELVAKMEEQMEADYMPFYVQDLRTNEIMSFHAFLEETSEDFSVEYTSQDGYGRMDKVQIYKGATRKISVSFKMVATNQEDHDLMWYKINRLAMTIYPQWTQGREVSVGSVKFIQPFSQIPGATPVIRLRLGDLWRSNYSKQSIARLFGATTLEGFNVFGTDPSVERRNAATAAATRRLQTKLSNFLLAMRGQFIDGPTNTTATPPTIRPQDIFTDQTSEVFIKLQAPVLLLAFEIRFVPPVAPTPTPATHHRSHSGRSNRTQSPRWSFGPDAYAKCKYMGVANGRVSIQVLKFHASSTQTVGSDLVLRQGQMNSNIELSMQQFKDYISQDLTTAALQREDNTSAAVTDPAAGLQDLNPSSFFGDTENPILKSFSSTYGKGLAGVVTEFKIDYGDAKGGWGTDGVLRAPKFVTITLGMSVIHDIPLGLDSNGIMNAPIWPVGHMSRNIGGIKDPPNTLTDRRSLEDPSGLLGKFKNPLINRR